jgi:hypothetical protein
MSFTLECVPTMFDWPAKIKTRSVLVSVSALRAVSEEINSDARRRSFMRQVVAASAAGFGEGFGDATA